MYEEMLDYVGTLLNSYDDEASAIGSLPFRKRSEHTRRVFMWTQRLIEPFPDIDREAVLISAIFHDAGYSIAPKNHAEDGAAICERYLVDLGYEKSRSDFIVQLIRNHSNKELMASGEVPVELTLLLEADLLDETGALSILWDCMHEGSQPGQSYGKTLRRLNVRSMLRKNPMATRKAKMYWDEKQKLMKEFNRQLAFDLGIDNNDVV